MVARSVMRSGKYSTSYSTKGLDHLGLVAGMCQELGVSEPYQELSERVVTYLDLPCEGINFDKDEIIKIKQKNARNIR